MNKARPMLRVLLALALQAGLVASTAAAPQKQLLEYPSIHSPVVGTRGMVVSQNAIASEIGAGILRQGGNAVDAAVAMAFALAVTLPRAGNIGGDGFITLYSTRTGKVHVFDFRSVAPSSATLERFVDAKGKERAEASFGYTAPAVPGTVAGLERAHRDHGRLPWKTLVQPAIALATNGVVLSPDEAFVLSWGKERLSHSRSAQATFFKPDKSPYVAGETLRQSELAWSLGQIAAGGADAFYKGEIARRIAADMRKHGGLITLADLAAYRAVEREPLVGSYRGHTIYAPSPASSGGATLINMLNILEHFDLKPLGAGSAAALHLMAETMKLGASDRFRFLGDIDFVRAPVRGFISKAYAAERAKLVSPKSARPQSKMGPGNPARFESPSTTHISTADAQGNLVGMTYTLGADFGSGVMIEGTGILLNNQMNNFSYEQTVAAAAKRQPAPLNAMQPGKRMLSTMMPTIIFKNGKPWLVTGSPGGSTIIATVLQLVVNMIDFGLNVDEATHQPRIYQGTGRSLRVEPNLNPDTVAALKARGHRITSDETMGSAQSIMIENGLFLGGDDPRRPGAQAVPLW